MKEGKLGTVMHALGGTFLVMVQCLDFRATLVVRGVIQCSGLKTPQLKTTAAEWEPLQTKETVYARTDYFGYKFLSLGSPKQAVDVGTFT